MCLRAGKARLHVLGCRKGSVLRAEGAACACGGLLGAHIWEHFGVFGPEMSFLPLVTSCVMQWDTPIPVVPACALLASQSFGSTPLGPQLPFFLHALPWFRLALLLTRLFLGTHTHRAQEQGNAEQSFQEKKHLETRWSPEIPCAFPCGDFLLPRLLVSGEAPSFLKPEHEVLSPGISGDFYLSSYISHWRQLDGMKTH